MTADDLPDTLTITLRKPIEIAGITYDRLELREPTAGEMKKLEGKTGTTATIDLLFMVTGVPIGALDKLGVRDLRKATDYLEAFFTDGPSIGGPG
jgi:hypothetical protein